MMNKVTIWISALITGLYTIFVAQCFWNWFAVPVLPVSTISFWQMVGIFWLISFFTKNDDSIEKNRWEIAYKVLELCLPEEKKQMLEDFSKKETETKLTDFYGEIFIQLFANTTTLILGFVVHEMFL